MNIRRLTLPVCLLAAGVACSGELAPFEDLADMRVLAIRADDPDLLPETSTTLRALIYTEPDTTVSYAWDWCPFSTGASSEYECALSQQEIDELVAGIPGAESPSLQLGNTPEVPFVYPLPAPVLEGICGVLQGQDLPEGVTLIDCKDSFPITLRLIATSNRGHRVVAVKTMRLLYKPPEPASELNTNPAIEGVRIVMEGQDQEAAVPLVDGFAVARGVDYTLLVDVDDVQSQTYKKDDGELRENLLLHWLYEGGEMKEERTGFIDGFLDLDDLAENVFTPPDASFDRTALELHFVIRDERGGIGWATRTVTLE